MYVRTAGQTDLPGLYELCCASAGRKLQQDVFAQIFKAVCADSQRRLVVAVENEQIVGYADLQIQVLLSDCAPAAVLSEFYVAQPYRGTGVGTGMLIALTGQARAVGCTRLLANCSRVNLKSQAFLDRHGFVRVQHRYEKALR